MGLRAGDRLDRYVLKVVLGVGGQGAVWRAGDPLAPGEDRAIKLVHVGSAGPAQLERVRREARQLVQLQHPSLVRCYGMFEDLHREMLGIVMEYASGESLRDLIADPRFTDQTQLLLLAHVAGALAYVHQRAVIHRDVKLENVLVTGAFWAAPDVAAGVKLIDFGIAVESTNPRPLTQSGTVIGTPPYFAPEQLDPEYWGGTRKPTTASDVFAFGILAWKLLSRDGEAHPTGIRAGGGLADYAAAYRRAEQSVWPPQTIDPKWRQLLAAALALRPAHRLADGLSLCGALADVSPGTALPTTIQTAPTPRPISNRSEPATEDASLVAGGTGQVVRTVPGAPPPVVFGGAPQPRYVPKPRAGVGFALGFAVALGVVAFAAVALVAGYFVLSAKPGSSAQEPLLPSSPATTGGASTSRPRADTESAPRAAPELFTVHGCVPDGDMCTCCQSGHDCLGAGCSTALQPDEEFLLRVAGGLFGGQALTKSLPGGEVCVRTKRTRSKTICTPVHKMVTGSSPVERLPVEWRDISSDGFEIELKDARGMIVASISDARRNDITVRGVLCVGFRTSLKGTNPKDDVGFFLDAPDGPPPALCPPKTGR